MKPKLTQISYQDPISKKYKNKPPQKPSIYCVLDPGFLNVPALCRRQVDSETPTQGEQKDVRETGHFVGPSNCPRNYQDWPTELFELALPFSQGVLPVPALGPASQAALRWSVGSHQPHRSALGHDQTKRKDQIFFTRWQGPWRPQPC